MTEHRHRETWSPQDTGTLRERWAQGRSAAEIAREIGISRNAVIGKAHRLRLAGRVVAGHINWTPDKIAQLKQARSDGMMLPQIADLFGVSRTAISKAINRHDIPKCSNKMSRRVPAPRRRPALHSGFRTFGPPVGAEKFEAREVDVASLKIEFDDLNDKHCRWPGKTRPFTYCGHHKHGPLSYCYSHAQIAYRPEPVRVRV